MLDEEDPANDYDWSWGSFTDQNTTFDKKVDYQMDDVSNRTSVVETLPNETYTSVSYTSNALNQYTAIDATNRSHDDNGNLTDDGTNEYAYDYRNNLVYVNDGQTTLMTAAFDALGRRVIETVNGGNDTTYYFYDGEHAVEEYDDSDDLQNRFVYGQQIDDVKVMIARDRADLDQDFDTSEFVQLDYHHDMLGSVTHVTDVNEVVAEQYEYTPYGKPTIRDGQGADLNGQSDIGNPYMFTARRLDEGTGLYHFRRRAYNPNHGRFLQRDPLGYEAGPSLLEYVRGRPTRSTDPLGLKDKDEENPAAKPKPCEEKGPSGETPPPAVVVKKTPDDAVEYVNKLKEENKEDQALCEYLDAQIPYLQAGRPIFLGLIRSVTLYKGKGPCGKIHYDIIQTVVPNEILIVDPEIPTDGTSEELRDALEEVEFEGKDGQVVNTMDHERDHAAATGEAAHEHSQPNTCTGSASQTKAKDEANKAAAAGRAAAQTQANENNAGIDDRDGSEK